MRLAALLALTIPAAAPGQQSAPLQSPPSSTRATTAASGIAPAPSQGVRYGRLLIRNAMVIDGAGNPARGPMDIVVEGSTITGVRPTRPIDEFGSDSARARASSSYDR